MYFNQTAREHLTGSGCQICKNSSGENKVLVFLLKNKLRYVNQKKFADLRGLKKQYLRFDFYLQEYNLLIEYDGEQHHIPTIIKSGHIRTSNCNIGKQNLKQIQLRDKIKTNYCRSRHIHLLRIPYWHKHRIPELIDKKIQKIKSKM